MESNQPSLSDNQNDRPLRLNTKWWGGDKSLDQVDISGEVRVVHVIQHCSQNTLLCVTDYRVGFG